MLPQAPDFVKKIIAFCQNRTRAFFALFLFCPDKNIFYRPENNYFEK